MPAVVCVYFFYFFHLKSLDAKVLKSPKHNYFIVLFPPIFLLLLFLQLSDEPSPAACCHPHHPIMSLIYSPASYQGSFNDAASSYYPSSASSAMVTTAPIHASGFPLLDDPRIRDVLNSDIAIETLLNRLKQSIISVKDLAGYIKRRSSIEVDHINDIKRSSKVDSGRLGTYSRSLLDILAVNERAAGVGHTFVAELHTMHEDLADLARRGEKARKTVKDIAMRHEKSVSDAEVLAAKARARYLGFCDEMEKLKDPNNKAVKFGFKSKANVQLQEQELQAKITNAEGEYRQKVATANSLRTDLIGDLRPQYVKQLTDLIFECDEALARYLESYAILHENLLIDQSFIVAPETVTNEPSLKELAVSVDNQADFFDDIVNAPANSKKPLNRPDVPFVQHPYMLGFSPIAAPPTAITNNPSSALSIRTNVSRSPSPAKSMHTDYNSMRSRPSSRFSTSIPMAVPSYGTPLDELIEAEALPDPIPVPIVVKQCTSALDRFGLNAEGLYRHSGTPTEIAALKHAFDTSPQSLDLSNPARHGISDIHAVAGALKLYFQELPDPLLTTALHKELLAAVANTSNEWDRRDRVHEAVNKLPDNNYAVLRHLIFHLDRVARHESVNRMSIVNLGNMWGPLLMASGRGKGGKIAELALQAAVVETILYNCDHIFEAE